MRYRLRTLLIVLTLVPPLLALAWWYGKMALGLLVLLVLCGGAGEVLVGVELAWTIFSRILGTRNDDPRKDSDVDSVPPNAKK
jgi:hypothetical protein